MIFFNVSNEPKEVRDLSSKAGTEVAAGLASLMKGFESYEKATYGPITKDMKEAAGHFREASGILKDLAPKVRTEKIVLSARLKTSWEATRRLAIAVRPIVNIQLPQLPPRTSLSAPSLMKCASDLTETLAKSIDQTSPYPGNEDGARRVAIIATVLQVTGTLAAEAFAELAKPAQQAA
jgi:hypothetical protein